MNTKLILLRIFYGATFILGIVFAVARVQASPVEPSAGQWKTWILHSGSQFRLSQPPGQVETSNEWKKMRNEIKQRTSADIDIIHYWDTGSPGYRWFQITRDE